MNEIEMRRETARKQLASLYPTDPELNSSNRKGCIQEAQRLKAENKGSGQIYYVAEPETRGRVYHAYYLSDTTATSALALNQADNGYEGLPQLTVAEVLELGFPLPDDVTTTQLIGLIQSNW